MGDLFVHASELGRRTFLRTAGAAAVGLAGGGAGVLSGCDTLGLRGFPIRASEAVQFSGRGSWGSVLLGVADGIQGHVDARCEECGWVLRVGVALIEAGGLAASFICPHCSPAVRISVALTRYLLGEVVRYGAAQMVGILISRAEFFMHEVGPAETRAGTLSVGRSTICRDIRRREPIGRFGAVIDRVPAKLCYFTDVKGSHGTTQVYHRWYRNGVQTDRIPLKVGPSPERWRTWSWKRNLAPGAWITTVETADGAILETQKFFIPG